MSNHNIPSSVHPQLRASQELIALRSIKYTSSLTYDFRESSHMKKQFEKKIKSTKALKLQNCTPSNEPNQQKTLLQYYRIARSVRRIDVSTRDSYSFRLTPFSGLQHTEFDTDFRRSCLKVPTDKKYAAMRSLTLSPKIQNFGFVGLDMTKMFRLTHYSQLRSLDLSCSVSSFEAAQTQILFFQNNFAGLDSLDIALHLLVDSDKEMDVDTKLLAPFLQRVTKMSIKTNGQKVYHLPMVDDKQAFKNLKSLIYQENGNSMLSNPEYLSCFSNLTQISRLELEFFVSTNDKTTIFDHLRVPEQVEDLKIVFANCRFSLIEAASPEQQFFKSLYELKELKCLEFEAFRLSILKEAKESCTNFVKNMLRSLDSQLKVLKLKGPPTEEVDDEFYQLLMKQTSLKVLDVGLTVKPSPGMAAKMADYRGVFKNLLLYNNVSLLMGMPKNTVARVEELCIYYGIHVNPSSPITKSCQQFLEVLKKVKTIRTVEKLSLYFSMNADDCLDKIISDIEEIFVQCKKLNDICLYMRSTKLTDESEEKLRKALMKSKKVTAGALKFYNKEIAIKM